MKRMPVAQGQNMRIRKAKAGDEKGIAQVINLTWKDAYRGIVPAEFLNTMTTERHEEMFRENIRTNSEAIFVLEDGEREIVGMASGAQDRSRQYDCELVAIYILPAYQKKGLGKELFKEIIAEHRKNKYRSMIIWTLEQNKDRAFYEKLGGQVKARKTIVLDGQEMPLAGYVWEDISQIMFD